MFSKFLDVDYFQIKRNIYLTLYNEKYGDDWDRLNLVITRSNNFLKVSRTLFFYFSNLTTGDKCIPTKR